jgi:pimeloyl-ACP methyl ester carboxylesterase
MTSFARLAVLIPLLAAGPLSAQEETQSWRKPVKVIADQRLGVEGASYPLYVSRDWSAPSSGITRAVLVLHGVLRNADVYYRSALKVQAAAEEAGRAAIMIAPQFLAGTDIEAFHLPGDVLRWSLTGWEGGDDALGPAPRSSFAALDAILARLGDRRLFPDLRHVVVAGHSGGGQVVQRYAIAGHGETALSAAGIDTQYVVANPSTYAYFSAERPLPEIASACSGFNKWKYGMDERPAYLAAAAPAELEKTYVSRKVTYLLGSLDTNPNHPALDRSCMAEAQGATRYQRGHAYAAALQARDGGAPNHRLRDVAGIGHDGDKMLTSACGLWALFNRPGC